MKLLKFLNLLDRQNNLSITNFGVFIILIKIATSPFDWATAAALLVTLLNYSHKRHIDSNQTIKDSSLVDDKINELKSKIESFSGTSDQMNKVLEEAKKVISSSNISNAFNKR